MIKDYIKEFDTDSEYQSYITGDPVLPNVSYIVETNGVEFKPYVPPPFFVKLSLKDGSTVELEGSGQLTEAMVSNQYKSTLVSAEIGELCTSIGDYAFYGCSSLTSVTIPNSVTAIGGDTFSACTGLTRLNSDVEGLFNIPDSVTSIGTNAFQYCPRLISITIPDSVTSIGGAFEDCDSLISIVVDSANTVYDSRDNCNAIIKTSTNELITGCKNTIIPDSVTSIGGGAFYNCSGLTSVTIPDSVTSIGRSAFSSCSGLTSITCNAATAPTIQSNTFYNVKTGGILTVPSGSTGYNVWMGTGNYYLGQYRWTKVEQ